MVAAVPVVLAGLGLVWLAVAEALLLEVGSPLFRVVGLVVLI
jgi:hypothetical protein